MKNRNLRLGLMALVSIIIATAVALPVYGAPYRQNNLLKNPGFEDGTYKFSNQDAWKVPNSWQPWWKSPQVECQQYAPNYNLASVQARVRSGNHAASYWIGDDSAGYSYDGGLLQSVSVQSGATYRFTIWGHSWSNDNRSAGSSNSSASVIMQIGIDPNGGNNPADSDIVWSPEISVLDQFKEFSVEAKATGGSITVYVRARPSFCFKRNDTYWDDANLVQVSGPSANPTATGGGSNPSPTNTPQSRYWGVPVGSIPVSQPDENGVVKHKVGSGESLIGIVVSYDAVYGPGVVTIDSVKSLNNMNSTIIRLGQTLTILEGVGAGEGEDDGGGEDAGEDSEDAGEGESDASEDEPTPTEEPTEVPAPEETEVPDAVAEVPGAEETGTLCIIPYNDANANSLRDPGEGRIPGATFSLNDGTNTISTYTTAETEDTHCFPELLPGTYIVTWVGDGLEATSDQTWSAEVEGGATINREFGIRPLAAETAEEVDETVEDGGFPLWLTALIGAVGVIIFLSGLGAAGYFILMRTTAIEE